MQRLIVLVSLVFLPFIDNLAQVPAAVITGIDESKSAGHILTGNYTFVPDDGHDEQGSTYQWYRADDASGLLEDLIVGANEQSYTVKPEDIGKYLAFEVVPIDNNGHTGLPVKLYYSMPIVNDPPTVTLNQIDGSPYLNNDLTVVYSQSDTEKDPVYIAIQWSRSGTESGSYTDIPGAINNVYRISNDDKGQYLKVTLIPSASSGATPGTTKEQVIPVLNAAPVAEIIGIGGTPHIGQELTVSFSIVDLEEDPATPEFKWYRSDLEFGTYIPITTTTVPTYTIVSADKDKFLMVELTPIATETATRGITVSRKIKVVNTAPVATIHKVDGIPNVGQSLSVDYSVSDLEDDVTSATFQWLSASAIDGDYTNLADGTGQTYLLKVADKDNYIKIEVTPHAESGITPGDKVSSVIHVLNTAPTALVSSISGTPHIGQTLTVEYTLDDLEEDDVSATFQWLRSSDPVNSFDEIAGATGQSYILTLDDRNKYLKAEVTPRASNGPTPGTPSSATIHVLNTPPVASNVHISGAVKYNSPVTGNFSYSDVDLDDIGVSLYKWFIASSKNGSYSQIPNATQTTYLIKLEDVGKYIFFEVTPVAISVEKQGSPTHSDTVYIQNQAPVASNVYIQGTLEYGSIIRGRYTYSDLEGNAQGTSLFKWYRADYSDGLGKVQISGANMETYVVQLADLSKYISFEVTPVASLGTATGNAVASSFVGPIMNAAPKATSVQIMGTQAVCKELTGQYTYSDAEGNDQGNTTFRWLRAAAFNGPKEAISGATHIKYTLTTADQGTYIYFEVTPRAVSGEIDGQPVISSPTGAISNLLPTVTFSGGTSICAGKTANLSLVFSGSAPFILNYTNGAQKYSLTTSSNIYNLAVTAGGTYKADSLKDSGGCTATNLPSQTLVTVNPLPDVQITGLNEAYSVYGPPVALTGIPANGTFSGPGVVPSTKMFYPNIAGVANSPHTIVYSYTNTSTGCANSDTVKVKVLGVNAAISGLRDEGKYCNLDKSFIITGVNSKGATGTFSINGGGGLTDHGNNSATINPSILPAGQYTISYSYLDNVMQTLTSVITIVQEAKAVISNVPDLNYCQNEASVKLTGNYASGVFSGSGISQLQTDFYFNPKQAAVGKDKIYYTYTASYGCKTSDSLTFTVFSSPGAQFEVKNRCWNGDSTVFINLSEPLDSITSWEWNFGDNTVTEVRNKSAKFEPKHLYASSGDKKISLIAQNVLGCKDTITKTIHLGDVPKVDFTWDKECFAGSGNVSFTNKTISSDAVKSYLWTITDNAETPILIDTKDVSLTFPQKKQYSIKLKVFNMSGCKDSTMKQLVLRPIHFIKDSAYNSNLETANNKWFVAPTAGAEWTWNTPDGSVVNNAHSGSKAFYTRIVAPRTSRLMEVSSACFDFTDVQKPFYEMWVNFNSETGKEGAQLQYTWDDSATWKTIGMLNSGHNWYNDNAISGLPSTSRLGWSGNSNGWILVRHNLDELKGQKNIKFRIIYGVNSTSLPKDGFAFDDIQIGQRAKSVLFEHFTNLSSTASVAANSELYKIMDMAGVDAYSIQYHTSFPGLDTINQRNSQDVASRVLYYGVGSVPNTVLDGGYETSYVYDFVNRKPSINDVNIRALKDPDFDLEIISEYKMPSISGNIAVKALKDISGRNISLHIAVVEDVSVQIGTSVVTNYNVLKKFLPSATGTLLKTNWTNGEVLTVDYSWMSQFIYNSDKVKIIAYIQDEQTREVYQVKMLKVTPLVSIKPVISSLEDKLAGGVYPNPVSTKATLTFNKALTQPLMVRFVDKNGRILNSASLQKGIGEYLVDFTEYPNGLYFIHIIGEGVKPEVLKVMVMH